MTDINRDTVEAPWTAEQVERIAAWQATPWVHQLTCRESEHGALAVTGTRLQCLMCGYTQTWVPRLIVEHGPPPDPRVEFGLTPRQIEVEEKVNAATYDRPPLAKLIGVLGLLKPDLEWLLEDVARMRARLGWSAIQGMDVDYAGGFARLDTLEAAVRDLLEHLPEAEGILTELQGGQG